MENFQEFYFLLALISFLNDSQPWKPILMYVFFNLLC